MTKRHVFASVLIVALAAFQAHSVVWIEATPGGGGGVSFELDVSDAFTSDVTGWTARTGDQTSQPSMSNPNDDLNLDTTNQFPPAVRGAAIAPSGPTTRDVWAIMEYAVDQDYAGIGFRHEEGAYVDPDYNLAVRINANSDITFRWCVDDAVCTDILATPFNLGDGLTDGARDGDWIGVMVAGESSDDTLEMCAWYWRNTSPPSTPTDPTSWGDALYCITERVSLATLADYSACGAGTTCIDNGTPGTVSIANDPASGQLGLSYYVGAAGAAYAVDQFYGGDITGL